MSALEDRRRKAREAARVSADVVQSWALGAIEVGVESATRVEITDDIIEAARTAAWLGSAVAQASPSRYRAMLIAAFRAAGFEVVT